MNPITIVMGFFSQVTISAKYPKSVTLKAWRCKYLVKGVLKMSNPNNHVIYLAGGCFWGVEEYFSRVPGVLDAVSGYANGSSETTRYELISQTGHAETVQVTYDAGKVTLREILLHFSVSSIL